MSKRELYMKYLVLKMDDRLDLAKLYHKVGIVNYCPKIRDIAQDILDCLIEQKETERRRP